MKKIAIPSILTALAGYGIYTGASYISQKSYTEGYNEGIYRASPQYREIETMRERAKGIGMLEDDADFRIAVDKLKHAAIIGELTKAKIEDIEIKMEVANKTLEEVLSFGAEGQSAKTEKKK